MIIANPIYDVVFKKMMENLEVANYFISTFLEMKIETIEFKPQENVIKIHEEIEPNAYTVYKLDFIATIKISENNYKKVLIEIQKSRNIKDIMRFRNYIAEQYKKTEVINHETKILPIVTIFVLGFDLQGINTPCLRVQRDYVDMINHKKISATSEFIESLTHDCFIIQVLRIEGKPVSNLQKLLSIFEQEHFTDNFKTSKQYLHQIDTKEIKMIIDILREMAASPEDLIKIEAEKEAYRVMKVYAQNAKEIAEEKFKKQAEEIMKKNEIISEKDKELTEKDKELTEKDKELTEKDKELTEKDKELTEKDKELTEKDKEILEIQKQKDKEITEKDKEILELKKILGMKK